MIYAVGDLHGHRTQLDRVLDLIETDGGGEAPVVFLGDYTDRGPDSRAVIDALAQGMVEGRAWTCLLGNHDRLFRGFLRDGTVTDGVLRHGLTWLHPRMGGNTTLASYIGGRLPDPPEAGPALAALLEEARDAVPAAHLAFLDGLVTAHETADHLFVHAGIRPGIPLAQQKEDDLLWIRAPFLNDTRDHGRLVVHGHTVVDTATHYGNRLNLDSGAGYGHPATVAVLEGREACVLTDGGRVPLTPMA